MASTVLVIAGNLELLELLQAILARLPEMSIISVIQGQRGIELARSLHPALIVLSVELPDLPTSAVLQQLEEGDSTRTIPVLTIGPLGGDRRPAQVTVARHFTEPLDVRRLLDVSQQLLS